jgi:hypothetical protein
MWCVHYKGYPPRVPGEIKEGPQCDAFPKGIPAKIFDAEQMHQKPFPGDHGIQFEARDNLDVPVPDYVTED